MKVALLSGGSGKRLWPLSNDSCSKQYIKVMEHDKKLLSDSEIDNEETIEKHEKCSMLQRVYSQLEFAGLAEDTIIVASEAQDEIIHAQLGDKVKVVKEPMRRDTFSAVILACAYFSSKCEINENEIIVVLPVDPYVDISFFYKLKELADIVSSIPDTIGLIGAKPTYPSSKYGYIIKGKEKEEYYEVKGFKEKPEVETAKELINNNSLWNCGVFCFALSVAKSFIKPYNLELNYDLIKKNYFNLPCRSFDYEVLEKWEKIIGISYEGEWKDLGTWNTLAEEISNNKVGYAVLDEECYNTQVINTLDIPLIVMGVKDMVVVASYDGVFVSDKKRSSYIKDYLEPLNLKSKYEERRWGTIKTIDFSNDVNNKSITHKVKMLKNQFTTYHRHKYHSENIVIISGNGILKLNGNEIELTAGKTYSIAENVYHGIKTFEQELCYIQILVGNISEDDIERLEFEW